MIAERLKTDFQLLAFEAKGTAPASFITDNMQDHDITTEVGKEKLKWTASSLFAGARSHSLLLNNTFSILGKQEALILCAHAANE
jgi:hypothetical protein